MKTICQSSPGICPQALCVGNEGIGCRAPCSETKEKIIQE